MPLLLTVVPLIAVAWHPTLLSTPLPAPEKRAAKREQEGARDRCRRGCSTWRHSQRCGCRDHEDRAVPEQDVLVTTNDVSPAARMPSCVGRTGQGEVARGSLFGRTLRRGRC